MRPRGTTNTLTYRGTPELDHRTGASCTYVRTCTRTFGLANGRQRGYSGTRIVQRGNERERWMTEVTVAWGRVTLTEPRFALGCLHVLHAKMEEAVGWRGDCPSRERGYSAPANFTGYDR